MIDVVYSLGSGSHHNNIELFYSLKSVEKFLTDFRKIYIIGEHPGFDANYFHIPIIDIGRNREERIKNKILVACNHPDISNDFLFMNDDHFFTKPIQAPTLPYYHDGNIATRYKDYRKNGHYKRALLNSLMALAEKNYGLRYFDVHTPIIYNKDAFIKVMDMYDWNLKDGFVVKSLYCNTLQIEGEHLADCKINHDVEEHDLRLTTSERFIFSVDDQAINENFRKVMAEFYGSEFPIKTEISEKIES